MLSQLFPTYNLISRLWDQSRTYLQSEGTQLDRCAAFDKSAFWNFWHRLRKSKPQPPLAALLRSGFGCSRESVLRSSSQPPQVSSSVNTLLRKPGAKMKEPWRKWKKDVSRDWASLCLPSLYPSVVIDVWCALSEVCREKCYFDSGRATYPSCHFVLRGL